MYATNTKYPIICSPMNGVSDVNLAISCYRAGILPSLVLIEHNYSIDNIFDISMFEADLVDYCSQTDNGPILIACDVSTLARQDVFNVLTKYNVPFVEIINIEAHNIKEVYSLYNKAKTYNIIVTPKINTGFDSVKKICERIGMIDCLTIKGPNGAGRGIDYIVLEDEVSKIRDAYPSMTIIASGGINTSQDIKRMLAAGANIVSIGTVFSVCEESKVSLVTKQKLIEASYNDIERLTKGAKQNALVFSSMAENDTNNTVGLINGISAGIEGHIYAGTGIDYIHKIESIQDIVSRLVVDL